jgi:hypothetical protein
LYSKPVQLEGLGLTALSCQLMTYPNPNISHSSCCLLAHRKRKVSLVELCSCPKFCPLLSLLSCSCSFCCYPVLAGRQSFPRVLQFYCRPWAAGKVEREPSQEAACHSASGHGLGWKWPRGSHSLDAQPRCNTLAHCQRVTQGQEYLLPCSFLQLLRGCQGARHASPCQDLLQLCHTPAQPARSWLTAAHWTDGGGRAGLERMGSGQQQRKVGTKGSGTVGW